MTDQAAPPEISMAAQVGQRVAAAEVTALVLAARNGSRSAWSSLIRHYTPLVRSVAMRYRLATSGVDDVAQTVWLRLFETLDQLRDPRALPGWLTTTTQREALQCLEKRPHTQLVDPSTIDAWPDPSADRSAHRRRPAPAAADQAVTASLAELSARQRSLLVTLHAARHLPGDLECARDGGREHRTTRARCITKLGLTEASRAFLCATGPPTAYASA